MSHPPHTPDWPLVAFFVLAVLFTLSMVGAALVWVYRRGWEDIHGE